MLFSDIPGQNELKKKLIRSVKENRISHAQLFHGPGGCGKLALAIAYAQFITCTNKQENDSCGTCPSCLKYNKLVHPDLHFSFPTFAGKNDPSVDDLITKWREVLLDNPYISGYHWYEQVGLENKQGIIGTRESDSISRKLSLKSYESDYKFLIMWLPERLSPAAANKLLKLIEEPPEGTIFLLITEKIEDIIPTIRSRTQLIKIPKFKDEDIRKGLEKLFNNDSAKIEDAVNLSNGNFFLAINAIKTDEHQSYNFERFIDLMRMGFKTNVIALINWAEEMATNSRERQKMFLLYALRLLRENFMINSGAAKITHMAGYESEFSEKFSRFIHKGNVNELYEEFNKAYYHITSNAYAKLVFTDLSFKIIKLLKK